ncbi:esterase OVCA2 [Dunckerocampus dactyliophorus]|uniref:esterase OVCA2 n=1 Tax=Dunckerocampus dactyliophorus TaxID=161453 RepID=UPI002406D24C|nr:esterase OVCA2 [Dunckerocampus dactyliophorus]XP_054611035.1 esterase OVCA2 [Dunckerocampus dactyliophorus]XP_054611037.1 esterase OVCA2 [Dunckerocampus dactyliophorus]XP_054611038.1 esterase OVCA2 [Dunckerocampus dactyliophorus]XP_054611039.1 esterase OVCA2 [Dunckerocampus dactyliophorus]XP_054611040.1 esterase OVCA2 [Dunckerocampus dactyliophorus]XP_054611041.1 esterase OVCA2 [Dunckerocampus dactyliophorus]
MAPLRVLCVHGYRQCGASFRDKTGALRKLLKKQVELVYVDAPHCVVQVQENDVGSDAGGDQDCRGWWFSDPQAQTFSAQQQCEESSGLEESVAVVREAVKLQGPFDGILGFSQGAALVAMLCALQEQNAEPDFHFRFAVLVAAFCSACTQHHKFYSAPVQMPSLHVFGLEDRVIPDSMSRELLPCFRDPHILTHPGGHFVPAASAHRQTYQNFLEAFQ